MGLWNNLKHEYQIRYHTLSFKLSGELIVSKLELSQAESFSLSIDSLAVRWHWYPLLKGQLDVSQLYGNGLNLNLQPTPSEDQAEGGFLPTHVRNIRLQDVRIRLNGLEDSTEIGFTALRISEAVVQEEINMDSLLLDEAELKYHYFPKKSDAPAPADTSAFTLADLPAFSIGYLQVSRSSIAYQHAEQAHRLSKLELALNGWKSNDLLQFQLDQLAFAYQDTLDFDLHIQQGQVSEAVDTRLENIRLAFPGIVLHLGALDLKTEDRLAGILRILPSSLSFGALKRWYPEILSASVPAEKALMVLAGPIAPLKTKFSFCMFHLFGFVS